MYGFKPRSSASVSLSVKSLGTRRIVRSTFSLSLVVETPHRTARFTSRMTFSPRMRTMVRSTRATGPETVRVGIGRQGAS